MKKIPISAIILTYNEEKNIEKCLKSIYDWVDEIFIVDSFSNDRTVEIAKKYTDKIYRHEFITHSIQWNWAIKNLPIKNEWILGLDADQEVSEELKIELYNVFRNLPLENFDGFYVRRKQIFMGKWIKYGGYQSKYLLKIFKKDKVFIDEKELVDHHFYIKGKTKKLKGYIVENNIKENDISFWLKKHIKYAEYMAKEELNKKISFLSPSLFGSPDRKVIFLKNIYCKLPLFIRPFIYFIYRYFIRFGFLDGVEGLIFHFLQGFWFRFIVDVKIWEIKKYGNTRD